MVLRFPTCVWLEDWVRASEEFVHMVMAIVDLLPPENHNCAIVPGLGPLTSSLDLRI